MIEVTIHYKKKTFKSGRERFIYKDLVVKGHSSDGSINAIKCCAGVTAVTCGSIYALDVTECNIEINKGYFKFTSFEQHSEEMDIIIDTIVHQLANISTIYPQFFKEFNFIEEKQNG